ncbi:MAG: transcriptional repressor [Actinobacteria bacterium]|nr:transcriptional repressor [Actinomycetota bacterium]
MKQKNSKGLTKYRRLVLETLKEHPHSDAYEIHSEALKKDPKISLPTVYRALRFLKEKGFIVEHKFKENHSHYEIVGKRGTNKNSVFIHLVCEKCGKIQDAGQMKMDDIAKFAKDKKFSVDTSHLNIYGVCSSCLKNSQENL